MRRLSPLLAVMAILALAIPAAASGGDLRTFGTGDATVADGSVLTIFIGEISS